MERIATFSLVVLLGSALVSACSLSGLVFDRTGSGGESTSTSSTSGSTTSGSGAGGALPGCITGPSSSSGGDGSTETDCANGIDDDGDDDTDCSDSDCREVGYSCIRRPNDPDDEWEGPGVFYKGDPAAIPCCPSEYPILGPSGGDEPVGDAVTCSACSCQTAHTCAAKELSVYPEPNCANAPVAVPQDGACHGVPGTTPTAFTAVLPTLTLAADCTSTGGVVTNTPAARWSLAARICTAAKGSKSCLGSQVCAREPKNGGGTMCFWHTGIVDCPSDFPLQQTFFTDFNDERNCSQCTCGSAGSGASCSVKTLLYSSLDCSDAAAKIGEFDNPSPCFTPLIKAQAYTTTISVTQVSCLASGGVPTGQVSPSQFSAMTVCCSD